MQLCRPPWKPWIIQPTCSLVSWSQEGSAYIVHYDRPLSSLQPASSQMARGAHLLPLLPLVTFEQLERMIETILLYKHESERCERKENQETPPRRGNWRRPFHFITSAYYICLKSHHLLLEYKLRSAGYCYRCPRPVVNCAGRFNDLLSGVQPMHEVKMCSEKVDHNNGITNLPRKTYIINSSLTP